MRLSDIKGENVLDVTADLIVPIANIAMDKEASELFGRKPLPVGMTKGQFMMARAKAAVPALLKRHKEDVICILSTLAMKSREEYLDGLTFLSLIDDVYEVITDETIGQLFFSAQTNVADVSSGSALESTGEEA